MLRAGAHSGKRSHKGSGRIVNLSHAGRYYIERTCGSGGTGDRREAGRTCLQCRQQIQKMGGLGGKFLTAASLGKSCLPSVRSASIQDSGILPLMFPHWPLHCSHFGELAPLSH